MSRNLQEYMGISKAAVSKWEKEQCYPDITLLPQLATYFNISIDELFNYSPQLIRDDIRELCLKISADFTIKPFDEVMTECKEIIKMYYSCFSLLYHMAVLFVNHSVSVTAEENKAELLNEVKALCKRVISESDDALLAKDALEVKCIACLLLKEPEEVFVLLGESLRPAELAEDSLISEAFELTGNTEKAKEISQCGIFEHLMHLIGSVTTYVGLSYKDSFETAHIAYERLMELILLFNVEELNPNDAAKAYLIGAELYCKHGKHEKTYELLDKYADLCLAMSFPFKVKGDYFFTAVEKWLEDSELGSTVPIDERMLKQRIIESFEALPSLDVLHDEPRYKSILQRITHFR